MLSCHVRTLIIAPVYRHDICSRDTANTLLLAANFLSLDDITTPTTTTIIIIIIIIITIIIVIEFLWRLTVVTHRIWWKVRSILSKYLVKLKGFKSRFKKKLVSMIRTL